MIKPNFIIIGAQRSGTTSLYAYLSQHPEIYMSPIKEPRFFVFDGKDPIFYGSDKEKSEARYQNIRKTSITNFEDYCALFNGAAGRKAIGEASPHYLYCSKSAERIKYHIPEVKLIAILRDPVERAYSNFFLSGPTDEKRFIAKFAEAIKEEENKRLDDIWDGGIHYIRKGFYYTQLMRYYNRFDRNSIKIYLYEDLKENLPGLLQDIFRFLNVNDTFVPDTTRRFTESAQMTAKNTFLIRFFQKKWPQTLARCLFPKEVRQQVAGKLSSHFEAKRAHFRKPKLPSELRERLTKTYRTDIINLQGLLQRDLSKWLQTEET